MDKLILDSLISRVFRCCIMIYYSARKYPVLVVTTHNHLDHTPYSMGPPPESRPSHHTTPITLTPPLYPPTVAAHSRLPWPAFTSGVHYKLSNRIESSVPLHGGLDAYHLCSVLRTALASIERRIYHLPRTPPLAHSRNIPPPSHQQQPALPPVRPSVRPSARPPIHPPLSNPHAPTHPYPNPAIPLSIPISTPLSTHPPIHSTSLHIPPHPSTSLHPPSRHHQNVLHTPCPRTPPNLSPPEKLHASMRHLMKEHNARGCPLQEKRGTMDGRGAGWLRRAMGAGGWDGGRGEVRGAGIWRQAG